MLMHLGVIAIKETGQNGTASEKNLLEVKGRLLPYLEAIVLNIICYVRRRQTVFVGICRG
jgi:hypothetical protein